MSGGDTILMGLMPASFPLVAQCTEAQFPVLLSHLHTYKGHIQVYFAIHMVRHGVPQYRKSVRINIYAIYRRHAMTNWTAMHTQDAGARFCLMLIFNYFERPLQTVLERLPDKTTEALFQQP